jgi:DNA invertase Pin-like site-specific DNA recombinase
MTLAVIRQTVLYLRESKNDELGIDRHRDDLLNLCQREHWTPGTEYIDNDQSASPERRRGKPRPAYAAMMADAKAGKIGRILVWHADRLVRHPRDAEDVIDMCVEHGIELWDRDHHIDLTTDQGRLIFRILCGVARGEIERKNTRVKAAMVQRATQGPAWWPTRPFGYALQDDSILKARAKRKMVDGRMTVHTPKWSTSAAAGAKIVLAQREASALRKAYSSILAGMSLKAIAREWNSKGLLTPKGNEWDGMAVKQVLLAARNAGLRTYGKDKEVVGKGDWPAIVTENIWREVVAKLTNPARLVNGSAFPARKYVLSGLARCSECGHTVSSAIPSNTRRPVYICKKRGCGKVRRSVADVDAWAIEHAIQRLSHSDPADLLGRGTDVNVGEMNDQANAYRSRLDELASLFAAGTITGSQLATGTADLKGRIAELEREMLNATKSRVLEGLIGVADVRERLAALPIDRQRAVIDRLVSVTIHPGQKARGPFDGSLVVITPKS